jgi:hypothetical protein
MRLGTHPDNIKIVVTLGSNPSMKVKSPVPQIIEFLRGAQIKMDLKDCIRVIVESSKSRVLQVSELQTLDLDAAVLSPVLEYLLADSRDPLNGDS